MRVTPAQDGQPLAFDAILLHMETLFGLTELTMWVILYKMVCYKKKVMVLLSIFKVGMI